MSLSQTIVCWLVMFGSMTARFSAAARHFTSSCTSGDWSWCKAAPAFGKDLPPFVVAAERNSVFGVNVIGLRRAGFSAKDREEIKAAFKLVYLSGLNISQAIEKAATMKLGKVGPRVCRLRRERKETWHLPTQTREQKGRGNLTLLRTIILLAGTHSTRISADADCPGFESCAVLFKGIIWPPLLRQNSAACW